MPTTPDKKYICENCGRESSARDGHFDCSPDKKENCDCDPNDNVNFPCNCPCHRKEETTTISLCATHGKDIRECCEKCDTYTKNYCGHACWNEKCKCHAYLDPFASKILAEFDKKFGVHVEGQWTNENLPKIKDFLRSALNAQKEESKENNQFYYNRGFLDASEEIWEKVQGISDDQKEPTRGKTGRNWQKIRSTWHGYQKALSDVLALLSLNNKDL